MSIKIKYGSVVAILLLGVMASAQAARSGAYVGGQVGSTNTHNEAQTIYTNNPATPTIVETPTNTGIGARFFGGININEYAAVEMGYTYYAASTFSVPESTNITNDPAIRESGIDVVGKAMIPFANSGAAVFGKAGFSVMHAGRSGSLTTPAGSAGTDSQTGSATSVSPVVGVGISYDVSQNWVADLSYTHVLGSSNIKAADFVGLGISYHWVDLYCGQFLC